MSRRNTSDLEHNRRFWETDADDYQAAHHDDLAGRPLAWGAFRVPESELQVLGDVRGRDVLDLGCGGGQWSVALAAQGARVVGLDVSAAQLVHARKHARNEGADASFVNASGDTLPFASGSFDLVLSDHGAMSFCDPEVIVPEVSRVLRSHGRLVFCTLTPLLYLTWNAKKERQGRRLFAGYDDLGRMRYKDGTSDWVLPAGHWVRCFRTHGFDVDDLVELRAPKDATTTFDDSVDLQWARNWPAEWIWAARKR